MSYVLHVPHIFHVTDPPVCHRFTARFWANNLTTKLVCATLQCVALCLLFPIDCTFPGLGHL
jgi:hypothetical protein